MDSSFYIIGPVIGFIGMMSGGYWGVGCGWIVVPTMLILGCDPIQAVGIGLLQMVPSTILTVSKQASQIGWTKGAPGFSLALPIGAGAAVTSLFGKTINAQLIAVIGDARWLQWMLIVIIAVIICQTLGSRTACYNDEMPLITAAESRIAFVMGLVTGIVSSMARRWRRTADPSAPDFGVQGSGILHEPDRAAAGSCHNSYGRRDIPDCARRL